MNQTNYKKTRYNVPFIAQRADPYIMQEDGMYYFTASVPAYDCIVLRRASSLEGLREVPETEIWHCH
ncbi:MAG: alpha-N-arabinofuranosidase, partial [Oscillospiraceae bacterium]|nr:alpha-N-arabinofuranosidase [Oscillospiraceae bacterium]